jgi:hypothetical protein
VAVRVKPSLDRTKDPALEDRPRVARRRMRAEMEATLKNRDARAAAGKAVGNSGAADPGADDRDINCVGQVTHSSDRRGACCSLYLKHSARQIERVSRNERPLWVDLGQPIVGAGTAGIGADLPLRRPTNAQDCPFGIPSANTMTGIPVLKLEGAERAARVESGSEGFEPRAAEFRLLVRATRAHSRIAQTGSMQPKQPRQRSATRTMPSCRGMSTQSRARAVPSPTCR